jgi:hypothetical protein
VADDAIDLTASPARPLCQLLSLGGTDGCFKGRPAGLQNRLEKSQPLLVDRSFVGLRSGIRRAEIRGRSPGQALNDLKCRDVLRRLEIDPGSLQDASIARPGFKQGLQSPAFIPPAPAPSRPIDRASEGLLFAGLEIDIDSLPLTAHLALLNMATDIGLYRTIHGRRMSKRSFLNCR